MTRVPEKWLSFFRWFGTAWAFSLLMALVVLGLVVDRELSTSSYQARFCPPGQQGQLRPRRGSQPVHPISPQRAI
ncbi:hypothetical protein LP415_01085 [Polaromonas sp. P1(28)-8]|nr:hypothetical protein LP415_01085 [Polaromonas sp. P1(28)-8]